MTDDCENWEAEQARVVSELRERINDLLEVNAFDLKVRKEMSEKILSIATEASTLRLDNARLRDALRDIMRHQECIGGDLAKIGATWRIAEKAVSDGHCR